MSIEQTPGQDKVKDNQLPPLGPTADVPMKHRDDVHDNFSTLAESFHAETATVPPEHQDDKDTKTSTKSEKRKPLWVKAGLGLAGIAAVTATAFGVKSLGGSDKMAPDPDEARSSASVNEGEVVNGTSNPLEKVGDKATPEQIQYVIDNPVNVKDHPTIDAQLEALSARYTTIENAGELDYSVDGTDVPLTDESAGNFRQMAQSYFLNSGDGYNNMLEGLEKRAKLYAADRDYNVKAINVTKILATSEPTPGPSANEVTVDVQYQNSTESAYPNEVIDADGNGTLTLFQDPETGDILVSGADITEEIGDID